MGGKALCPAKTQPSSVGDCQGRKAEGVSGWVEDQPYRRRGTEDGWETGKGEKIWNVNKKCPIKKRKVIIAFIIML